MEAFFQVAGIILLGTCLAAFRVQNPERQVTLSLLQVLAALPILAGLYVFFAGRSNDPGILQTLLFAEGVFGVVWIGLAFWLGRASGAKQNPRLFASAQCMLAVLIMAAALYSHAQDITVVWTDRGLAISHYWPAYFFTVFLLLAILFAAWQLEAFWRTLEPARRWAYRFMVIGGFATCGALGWAASYRLTYGLLVRDHFFLLAALLTTAWALMVYAVARHKLLNRKIFISRKIVYSFVAPTVFAVYLIALGLVSLLMRTYGLTLPFVVNWMAVAFGGIVICLLSFSGKLRQRVKFFISTHFYVNKYEYRNEWLALSAGLKGAETEAEVVDALRRVMSESLYSSLIVIWTGDREYGYKVAFSDPPPENPKEGASKAWNLAPQDPLVDFLTARPWLDVADKNGGPLHQRVLEEKKEFLSGLGIVLMAPLSTGDQVVGLIGLGPEFTGGVYGQDDYDLLTALGSHAAAALVAVRMAENLADERERKTWERLSAFVLHDIKNAAAMLSLVRANAPGHIHKHNFQEDMLEVVDDALARMEKVQKRLGMLKAEIDPAWTAVELRGFLDEGCGRIKKKLPGMSINFSCPPGLWIRSDPRMLMCILENLLLNAFEACTDSGPDKPRAQIDVQVNSSREKVSIMISDNGPGIDEKLLPEALFEPMQTTREKGNGIGLWQARQLAKRLQGGLLAGNGKNGGAEFIVELRLQ